MSHEVAIAEMELIERAKRDPRQFEALYDRHFERIYRFVYSRVREKSAAEDVTSEVFTKALGAISRYEHTGRPFLAWLHRIALNAIADRGRTLHNPQRFDELEHSAGDPDLDELAARRDELRRIWALVDTLPRNQRTALVLRFRQDMRVKDIAAAMGKSSGAVKVLLCRGVSHLRTEAGALRPAV